MSIPPISRSSSPVPSHSGYLHRSATSSQSLSAKSIIVSVCLPTRATFSTSLARSPALKVVAASVPLIIPAMNLPPPQQDSEVTMHNRSQSVPSLAPLRTARRTLEFSLPQATLVRETLHSSSAANLLGLRRDEMKSGYASPQFPQSPRLKPCSSPGPVTPMALDEDVEYRFPIISTAPIRHSSLGVPTMVEEDEADAQQILEMPRRSHL